MNSKDNYDNKNDKYDNKIQYSKRKYCLLLTIVIILIMVILMILYQNRQNRRRLSNVDSDLNPQLLNRQAKTMLNNKQKERLTKIINHEITRKDVEIVIARYKNDITWSDMYKSIRTVYDKGYNESYINEYSDSIDSIKLPNVGRESHTYLHHIVNNYDDLADITIFTQDGPPISGSDAWKFGGGHLLNNFTFHDLVLNENGLFVFTNVMLLSNSEYKIRFGYSRGIITREIATTMCPTSYTHQITIDSPKHLGLLKHIANRCIDEKVSYECSIIGFWKRFIKLPLPKNNIIFFAQGSIFSVSKHDLLKRPKSDYEDLLHHLSINKDPSSGYFMEWLWYYLATSNTNPCPINGNEFNNNNKNNNMKIPIDFRNIKQN